MNRTTYTRFFGAASRWRAGAVAAGSAALASALLAGCVTAPPSNGPDDLGPILLASLQSGLAPSPTSPARTEALADTLQRHLSAPSGFESPSAAYAAAFYQARAFAPAWTDASGPTARGHVVREVLSTAWADEIYGLTVPPAPTPPHDGPLSPDAIVEHDIALSGALADYIDRATARRPPWASPLLGGVTGAMAEIAVEDVTDAAPGRLFHIVAENDRFARLRRGLLQYQALVDAGGWPAVSPDGPKIEPGGQDPEIRAIRARLRATNDLPPPVPPMLTADASTLDPSLEVAVRRFQARHGLAVDGTIGPRTRTALAMPVERRVQQMALNLRRLRDMPPAPDGRSVEVNIAGATLDGRDNGVTVFQTDVIVGMRDRPTPRLSSAINQLVLNPTWTVPTSIAEKDILPKLRDDPGYLAANGFQLFDGWTSAAAEIDPLTVDWDAPNVNIRAMRLRQAPGGGNALGRIKFLFPNQHDVYLHSTPSHGLFGRSLRTFSSGCVRVRDPLDLAVFILNEPDTWTRETLAARIQSGETRTLRLAHAVPVSIIYLTAWVAEDGTIQFRRDVYDLDARSLAANPDVS